jgi:hypothetical protein
MGRCGPRADAPKEGELGAAAGTVGGEQTVLHDRLRVGWGAVAASVTLLATILLTVPGPP